MKKFKSLFVMGLFSVLTLGVAAGLVDGHKQATEVNAATPTVTNVGTLTISAHGGHNVTDDGYKFAYLHSQETYSVGGWNQIAYSKSLPGYRPGKVYYNNKNGLLELEVLCGGLANTWSFNRIGTRVADIKEGDVVRIEGLFGRDDTNYYYIENSMFKYNGSAWVEYYPTETATVNFDINNVTVTNTNHVPGDYTEMCFNSTENCLVVNGAWDYVSKAGHDFFEGGTVKSLDGTETKVNITFVKRDATGYSLLFVTWGNYYVFKDGDVLTINGTTKHYDIDNTIVTVTANFIVEFLAGQFYMVDPSIEKVTVDYGTEVNFWSGTTVAGSEEHVYFHLINGFDANDTIPVEDWGGSAKGANDIRVTRGAETLYVSSALIKMGGQPSKYCVSFQGWRGNYFAFQTGDVVEFNVAAKQQVGNKIITVKFQKTFVYDAVLGKNNAKTGAWLDKAQYDKVVPLNAAIEDILDNYDFTAEMGTKVKNAIAVWETLDELGRSWVPNGADLEAIFQDFQESITAQATEFCEDYLKMDFDNEGQCYALYAEAKAFFLTMIEDTKWTICFHADFADALARLQAWARANGEEFTTENNGTFVTATTPNGLLVSVTNENTSVALLVCGVLTAVATAGFFFIRRRKFNA